MATMNDSSSDSDVTVSLNASTNSQLLTRKINLIYTTPTSTGTTSSHTAIMNQLISDVDILNKQQSSAETDRRTALDAASTASLEISSLESSLHKALRTAADLDDDVHVAKEELALRVAEKINNEEELTAITREERQLMLKLESLRQELEEKTSIITDLKHTLLTIGLEEAVLQEIDAEASTKATSMMANSGGGGDINEGTTEGGSSSTTKGRLSWFKLGSKKT